MRHRNKKNILDRESSHRGLLLRNMATSLVLYDKVKSTEARIKALRPYIERLVTRSREPTLANRRILLQHLLTPGAVRKMCEVIGPRYKERTGGYTRITHCGTRRGDAAKIAIIEFV